VGILSAFLFISTLSVVEGERTLLPGGRGSN
jgi:hypothetical protein